MIVHANTRVQVAIELSPQADSTTSSNSAGQVPVLIQLAPPVLLLFIWLATRYGEMTAIQRLLVEQMS